MLKRGFLFYSFVIFALVGCTPAFCLPTLLNCVPSVDLVPNGNLMFQTSYYQFDFKDAASKAATKKQASPFYSIEYGFKKAEFGVDLIGEKSFSNSDSALYAGPISWNFKYRLLSQGLKKDKFSLALGSSNLGATSYSQDYYGASPYVVASKAFKDFRGHLGYQWNILGYKRLDTDRKKNNDFIGGLDATIIKDKKQPVSFLIDYAGGPGKMVGLGFWHTLSPKWGWGVSTFHPLKRELPISKFQLPKQYWVGVSYYLPLK